jgi:plasmid stability protein
MAYGASVEKTTLYLPAQLQMALRDAAKRQRRSVAALVREALETYLRGQDRPALTSVGAGEDDELSGAESETYLRSRWTGR